LVGFFWKVVTPPATAVALLCAEDTTDGGNVNAVWLDVVVGVTVPEPVAPPEPGELVEVGADDASGGSITGPDVFVVAVDVEFVPSSDVVDDESVPGSDVGDPVTLAVELDVKV
jgi:hypothetical protein